MIVKSFVKWFLILMVSIVFIAIIIENVVIFQTMRNINLFMNIAIDRAGYYITSDVDKIKLNFDDLRDNKIVYSGEIFGDINYAYESLYSNFNDFCKFYNIPIDVNDMIDRRLYPKQYNITYLPQPYFDKATKYIFARIMLDNRGKFIRDGSKVRVMYYCWDIGFKDIKLNIDYEVRENLEGTHKLVAKVKYSIPIRYIPISSFFKVLYKGSKNESNYTGEKLFDAGM